MYLPPLEMGDLTNGLTLSSGPSVSCWTPGISWSLWRWKKPSMPYWVASPMETLSAVQDCSDQRLRLCVYPTSWTTSVQRLKGKDDSLPHIIHHGNTPTTVFTEHTSLPKSINPIHGNNLKNSAEDRKFTVATTYVCMSSRHSLWRKLRWFVRCPD